jgi:hypothetical protein
MLRSILLGLAAIALHAMTPAMSAEQCRFIDPRFVAAQAALAAARSDLNDCVGVALFNQPHDGKTDPASIASAVAPKCAPYYEELVAQMKCLRMPTPNSQIEFIAALLLRAQNVIPPRVNQEPRIQVMANIFVQNLVNDIDGQVKAQEHARQVLYETAGKECETLRATIAKECQLESINVNVTVPNYGAGRPPDGFMVNSTFVYRITPK